MGYLCPTCGDALPDETPCPCEMDEAREDHPFARAWPPSLDQAMLCRHCGAQVDWWRAQQDGQALICPQCHGRRWTKNAGKRLRHRVGERDGWICHRCHLPIDPAIAWPHPLCPVADHHPVPRKAGGPVILANLKIAHSLCNGSSYLYARALLSDTPHSAAHGLAVIPEHRLTADAAIKPGEPTNTITPAQQETIDAIMKLGEAGGGLPLLAT